MSNPNMWEYEDKYAALGMQHICGVDEAGRGPLAGPVSAAAVILPPHFEIPGLDDSKKLSDKRRRDLVPIIKQNAIAYSVVFVDHVPIDEINILQATYEAMRQAVSKLSVTPDLLLNDAVTIPELTMKQVPIIKGDAKSISIAAASIVAKVTRDRMMVELDKFYPEYGFAKHKGYGTKVHIQALKEFGPCEIHRKTFIKKFV